MNKCVLFRVIERDMFTLERRYSQHILALNSNRESGANKLESKQGVADSGEIYATRI